MKLSTTIQLSEIHTTAQYERRKKSPLKQRQNNNNPVYKNFVYACSQYLGAIFRNCFRLFLRRLDHNARVSSSSSRCSSRNERRGASTNHVAFCMQGAGLKFSLKKYRNWFSAWSILKSLILWVPLRIFSWIATELKLFAAEYKTFLFVQYRVNEMCKRSKLKWREKKNFHLTLASTTCWRWATRQAINYSLKCQGWSSIVAKFNTQKDSSYVNLFGFLKNH